VNIVITFVNKSLFSL